MTPNNLKRSFSGQIEIKIVNSVFFWVFAQNMWDQGIIKAGKVQPLDTTKCQFQLFALSQMIPFASKISPKKRDKIHFLFMWEFPRELGLESKRSPWREREWKERGGKLNGIQSNSQGCGKALVVFSSWSKIWDNLKWNQNPNFPHHWGWEWSLKPWNIQCWSALHHFWVSFSRLQSQLEIQHFSRNFPRDQKHWVFLGSEGSKSQWE